MNLWWRGFVWVERRNPHRPFVHLLMRVENIRPLRRQPPCGISVLCDYLYIFYPVLCMRPKTPRLCCNVAGKISWGAGLNRCVLANNGVFFLYKKAKILYRGGLIQNHRRICRKTRACLKSQIINFRIFKSMSFS